MERSILFCGFGGQGIMLMGQLMGCCAQAADKHVTYYPTYGPEQRGGTTNCTAIISDKPIASPAPYKVDVLVAMNDPSVAKYLERVKPGGALIANSSQVKREASRTDIRVLMVDADNIAAQMGSPKSANMLMLGALQKLTGAVSQEQLITTMEEKLASKAEFHNKNRAAILRGAEIVEAAV